MLIYAIYEIATNAIKFIESRNDGELPLVTEEYAYLLIGETALSIDQYWVDNGELKTRPAQPSPFYDWNGTEWVLNNQIWTDNQSETVRGERDILLAECDWVVTKAKEYDEEVPQEWKNYRQALRDIPEQTDFPFNVVWPTKPS